jgi:hypothetical protein
MSGFTDFYTIIMYILGIPFTIFLTLILFNIMFYTDKKRTYVQSLQELLEQRYILVLSSIVGLFWPLFLAIDIVVLVYLLLVVYPTKMTFSLLNWYNRRQ